MSRDFSPEDRDGRRDPARSDDRSLAGDLRDFDRSSGNGSYRPPRHDPRRPEQHRREIHLTNGRAVLYDRDRGYSLTESQIHAIIELGRFRVIAASDLAPQALPVCGEQTQGDIRRLIRSGLVRKGTFLGPEGAPRELLTLTRRGHRLLRASQLVSEDQATYDGFVKPREANHDADLYRVYHKEAGRIAGLGGRNLRVVLDYELKRKIHRDIARFGSAAKQEIAARHSLRMVRQKIPVPDLRIEYETRDGEVAGIDLELVTEHYRGRQIRDKAQAGFLLYTPRGEADHLRRVLDQHELTGDIRSL